MEIEVALEIIRKNPNGTLATLRADGQPHLSVVTAVPVDGMVWVSLTQDRVKTANLRREPRATFLAGLGPWAAIEGSVVLQDGPDVIERLRLQYLTGRGEHPDWEEFDEAMRRDRRLIAELHPARAYGFGT